MDTLKKNIWMYGLLTPQEQQDIDQFVETHSELTDLLYDVKALYALFAAAGLPASNKPGDNALAYFVAQENMGQQDKNGPLADEYRRLKKLVENDREIYAQYLGIKTRMESIAAQSDPVSHFEQLTGYTLDTIPLHSDVHQHTGRIDRAPVQRIGRAGLKSWIRKSAYTLGVVLVGMVILLNVNKDERLAYLNLNDLEFEMPADMRGINEMGLDLPALDSVQGGAIFAGEQMDNQQINRDHLARFREATELMLHAQRRFWGIYYTYDIDSLGQAESMFESLLLEKELSRRLDRRSRFVLARIYLAEGRSADAISLLQELASDEDHLARSASKLYGKIAP